MDGSAPLSLLLLREKKPGHYRQVEAIARIVAGMVGTKTARLEIQPRWFAADEIRRAILMSGFLSPATCLKIVYGIDVSTVVRPDLVVGSGRPTVAAGIWLSRHFDTDFVFSGWARNYRRAGIALSLSHSPDHANLPGAAYVPIPSLVEADNLPTPRPLKTVAALYGSDLALLIGGNSSTHRYLASEWRDLAQFVLLSAQRLGIRWRVSTSRRSPNSLSAVFASMAESGVISQFVDYKSAGPGSADRLLTADALVVTEDSRSMIADGLAARRPVIALRPRSASYAAAKLPGLAVVPLRDLSPEAFSEVLMMLDPPSLRPREVIAAAIAPVIAKHRRID
jgi:mitochondrial fission protein ELM1